MQDNDEFCQENSDLPHENENDHLPMLAGGTQTRFLGIQQHKKMENMIKICGSFASQSSLSDKYETPNDRLCEN